MQDHYIYFVLNQSICYSQSSFGSFLKLQNYSNYTRQLHCTLWNSTQMSVEQLQTKMAVQFLTQRHLTASHLHCRPHHSLSLTSELRWIVAAYPRWPLFSIPRSAPSDCFALTLLAASLSLARVWAALWIMAAYCCVTFNSWLTFLTFNIFEQWASA